MTGDSGDAPADQEPTISFARLERTSVGLQAAESIKQMILAGELEPGTRCRPNATSP